MALTADRNTPSRAGEEIVYPVSAGKKCFAGGLAVMNAGTCEPGSTATGLVSVGRLRGAGGQQPGPGRRR